MVTIQDNAIVPPGGMTTIPKTPTSTLPIAPKAPITPKTPPATTTTSPVIPPNPAVPAAYDTTTGLLTDYGKSKGLPEVNKPVATTPTDPLSSFTTTDQSSAIKTASDAKTVLSQQYDDAYNSFKTTMDGYTNGSIPLTPGEQAQVNGLTAQYQNLIEQQKAQNNEAQGTANIRGYQTGSAEYDPSFQVKTIGAIASAGLQKLADLNTKMASSVAALTQSFKDNDIKQIKDNYDEYKTYEKDKMDSLQKTIDDTTKAIQGAFDNAEKIKKDNLDALIHSDTVSFQEKQQAISLAQLSETERHDKATELIQRQAQSGGSGIGGTMPSVSMTAGAVPNAAQQAAFLAALPPLVQTQIKGLADYSLNPSSFSTSKKQSQGGLTQGDLISLAKQYDPSYSEAQYATRQAYIKSLQSGNIYNGIVAGNKAINHLVAFTDSVSKLGNGWFDTLNAVDTNGTLNQTTKKNLSEAKTEANGLKDEMAKFFKGTGSTDVKSIDDWSKNLSPYASPAEQKGLIQGALNLLSGQLDVVSQGYQSTMGKAPQNSIIQPATIQKLSNLKNQGYTVDIPGVNYTDKDAYFKYGGGTPDQLIAAHDLLVQLNDPNNPPTPENALELAQLQQ